MEPRRVRLFRYRGHQTLLVPLGLELSGSEAVIRKDGDRLVVEPTTARSSLLDWLASLDPLDEAFPEIDDPSVRPES
jgi:antitoxin VapB